MAGQITLLDHCISPFATRVRIALREKGLEFESILQDLSNKSPLLLQMNPLHKKIPVLIHNNHPVCQSIIIVQYIDEVWTHKAPLQPFDPYRRARARFWTDYIDKKIFNVGRKIWVGRWEEQEAAKKEVMERFKVLESELGDKPYFGGDIFGFVDMNLMPIYSWFSALETIADFSLSNKCPKLVSWAKKCMERESVSKSMPDQHNVNVCDYIMEKKKNQDQHKSQMA